MAGVAQDLEVRLVIGAADQPVGALEWHPVVDLEPKRVPRQAASCLRVSPDVSRS